MSTKTNTTTIGLFIVTGVALGVTGLLLFSSSKLFSPTRDNILYFDSSLNGLDVGAPVKYRGVTVGSVKQVMIRFNQPPQDFSMPVIIQIEKKLLQQRLRDDKTEIFTEQSVANEIKMGLRATLDTESLVTGVLYINLDRSSNAPPAVFHQLKPIYPEIPTEPTQIQQLMKNLGSLDIKSLQTNLTGLITQLRSTVDELKMSDLNAGVSNLLFSANRMVTDPDITNALAALRPTLDQYRDLGAKVTSKIDPLADSITNSLGQADRALAQLQGAGENLKSMLAADAPLPNDLNQALEQISSAVQSLSVLLDFLKQHPNALITGRELPKRKP